MSKQEVISLLETLKEKSVSDSEKKKIEALIQELSLVPAKVDEKSELELPDKKKAFDFVDIVGKILFKLGTSLAARELLRLFHDHIL